jgi:two-component system chemotaxis response regulator CheY
MEAGQLQDPFKRNDYETNKLVVRTSVKRKGGDFMKRVLIVDDAAFMRMSIRNMLEKNNYEVVGEAENGAIGVKKFLELSPDIVTMDVTMPEMDGIQALREIKKTHPKAVILMLTAMGQECLVKEAVLAGAKGFLVKPFKEENFIKVLNTL